MDLITGPPSAEALATMAEIDGLRIEPVVLATQTGINGHLGPESAGAMLVLQGTFLDQERFNEFWMQVAELVPLLATAPGFIRRWAFADGPHYTFIAWWRSVADAHAFFSCDQHQEAIRLMGLRRWHYTHFAGLWEMAVPRRRTFFCPTCDGVSASSATHCEGCGTPLPDPFGGHDVPAASVS